MHVLVVADQPYLHDLLMAVAREAFSAETVHPETTLDCKLAEVRAAQIGLLLLDLAVGSCSGIEALTRASQRFPGCRIVVYSAIDDRGLMFAALRAGAAGYLSKACARGVMIAALRLVAAGGTYVPPEVLPQQIRVPVTERQRDVLRLLLKGYSNQRIAAELEISQSTVKQHTHAVFDALGVSSRAQLLATVARRGVHAD